jgi:hypothetical protein
VNIGRGKPMIECVNDKILFGRSGKGRYLILRIMIEKEIFIERLKKRTRKISVDVIIFCNSLKTYKVSSAYENNK